MIPNDQASKQQQVKPASIKVSKGGKFWYITALKLPTKYSYINISRLASQKTLVKLHGSGIIKDLNFLKRAGYMNYFEIVKVKKIRQVAHR